MTREEARDQIVIFMCDEQKVINDRDKQALEMAIQALEQSSSDLISRQDAIKAIDEKAKRIKNEDTLNGLAGAVGILFDLPSVTQKSETVTEFADRCRECGAKYGKLLKQEPTKTGHWIKVSDGYGDNAYICECSECKDTVWVYKDADRKWNFCPNCGAKMD